jgi:hypothetical protein
MRGPDSRRRVVICVHNFGAEKAEIDLSAFDLPAGKIEVDGRGLIWMALGGGEAAKEFTVQG